MDGYDKLAAFVGGHHEMSIFRRFSTLNAKNLLYLQAEIVNLEAELERIVLKDRNSGETEKEPFPYSVFDLKQSLQAPPGSRDATQWLKVLEIRQKLKEYNDALLQQSQISKFEEASKSNLNVLRDWLRRHNYGNFTLRGREAGMWEEEYTKDLISLTSHRKEKDRFTTWIRDHFVPWFHPRWGIRIKKPVDEESGVWVYEESTINTVASAISAVASSLLPTSTIFVLYFLEEPTAKLGAIVAFTALFSLALVTIVKARRIDTFVAAVTFAAVQAVFVGSTCIMSGGPNR